MSWADGHTGTTGVLGPGFWGTRRQGFASRRVLKSPVPERPVVPVCKISGCKISRFALELFYIEERRSYFIMGRGRRRLIEQSQKKPKRSDSYTPGGKPIVIEFRQKREIEEITVPEHAVDFMKNMNPQQLVDFLLPNDDDWHVETSSGNASES